jgi:cobalt-zinc-cadmium efflux system protein
MLVIACAGLVINLVSASALHQSHSSNLNVRGALLHVIGDALGSAGAIVAGILMLTKGWYMADPMISFMVGLLILYNSWRLVKDSVDICWKEHRSHRSGNGSHVEQRGGVASIHVCISGR